MIESASCRFIEILDLRRDVIYAQAGAAGAPPQVETILQHAVRRAYRTYVQEATPENDLADLVGRYIREQTGPPVSPAPEPMAMPADIWARLVAAVQIEAARLGGVVEQSMLAYDPLLAPRKKIITDEESIEGLNLSPWTRFVVAAAIVLIIGIVATIILTTRRMPAATTRPAAAGVHGSPGASRSR